MNKEQKIKKNQIWEEKEGKKIIKLTGKADGNRHWIINRLDRKAKHSHIHEGTLIKFYNLLK